MIGASRLRNARSTLSRKAPASTARPTAGTNVDVKDGAEGGRRTGECAVQLFGHDVGRLLAGEALSAFHGAEELLVNHLRGLLIAVEHLTTLVDKSRRQSAADEVTM